MKKFFILSLFLFLFLFGHNALASWDIKNFDNLTIGQRLSTADAYWSDNSSSVMVASTTCYSGNCALINNSGASEKYFEHSDASNLNQYTKFRIKISAGGFVLRAYNGATALAIIQFNSTSTVSGIPANQRLTNFDYGTWHLYEIETFQYTFRTRLDGGTWSDWINLTASNYINKIRFDSQNGATQDVYIDDFNGSYVAENLSLDSPSNNSSWSDISITYRFYYTNPGLYDYAIFQIENINENYSFYDTVQIASTSSNTLGTFMLSPDLPVGSWRWSGYMWNSQTNATSSQTTYNNFNYLASGTYVLLNEIYTASSSEQYNASNTCIFLFGTSTTASLACTDSEWSSADWWVNFKCISIKGFYDASCNATSKVRVGLDQSLVVMNSYFPFNLATNFYNSWQSSASSSLPTNLEFLDVADSDGNIYLNMSSITEGATSTMLIFGPNLFINTDLQNFLTSIRILSTYLTYATFLFGLYMIGRSIINKYQK